MAAPMGPRGLLAESEGDVEVSLVAPRGEAGCGCQVLASRLPMAVASCIGVGLIFAAACLAWTRSLPGGSAAPRVVDVAADAAVQLAASPDQCETSAVTGEDCGEPGLTQAQCEAKGCCYDESNWHHWCWYPASRDSSSTGGSVSAISSGSSGDPRWQCSLERSNEDCGHDGMTREECEAKGCCYDETASKWCYPKSDVRSGAEEQKDAKEDADGTCVKNGVLIDCGHSGITQQDCEAKGCCYDESADLWCFQKTKATAAAPGDPVSGDKPEGKDKTDGEETDGESAEELERASIKVLPSLFCFSVLAGGGDVELIDTQRRTSTGIFACDEWGKFTASSEAGHEEEKAAVPCWALTDTFIAAWKLVKEDGRYQNHDYVVKSDADTVFFPDRLRSWLSVNEPPHEDVYISSCKDSPGDLSGAMEVFSKSAVHSYLDEIDSCKEELEYDRWGEEVFTQKCMERAGVRAWAFHDMICDAQCSCDPASCEFGKIGYHPFNKTIEYQQCIKGARR